MCGDPLPLFGEDRRKVVDVPPVLARSGPLRYGELPS